MYKNENIVYFILKKELPSAKIGDQVDICPAEGREHLFVNGIELPYDFAVKYPDWFQPIYQLEHEKMCRENFIKYAFETYGKSESEAIPILESMR